MGTTPVVALAELFEVFGSVSAAVTVAELLSVPIWVGWITIVTVTVAPPATVPRLHVTMPSAWEQVP